MDVRDRARRRRKGCLTYSYPLKLNGEVIVYCDVNEQANIAAKDKKSKTLMS